MITLRAISLLLLTTAPAVAQLDPPILLPGDLGPRPLAEVQSSPAVARGGDQYLLVWEDRRANLTGTVSTAGYGVAPVDLAGIRLDAEGNVLDASPIVISQRPFEQRRAQVAWNGTEWLVVWQSRRVTQYTTTEGIYATRVSASGQVLDDPPIVIDDTDDVDEWYPFVGSDGTNWVVTWQDYDPAANLSKLRAAMVIPGGLVLFKHDLAAVSYNGYLPTNVRIAYGSGKYFLTSNHSLPGQTGGLWGQFLNPTTLDALGPEFAIPGGGSKPWIATDGTDFYVSWTVGGSWSEVRGTPVSGTGTVAIPGGLLIASTFQVSDPQSYCAWDGQRWLVSVDRWGGFGSNSVDATYLDAAGQILPGSPFTVDAQASSMNESVVCAGASPAGTAVVVWSDSRLQYADLMAARVQAPSQSTLLGQVSRGAPAQTHPDLDGDSSSGYLLTFLSRASDEHRVMAQRLDGLGNPVDLEPFEIAVGDTTLHHPRVAWNGALWLVVWEDRVANSGLLTATTYGTRVAPDGTLLDAVPFPIQAGNFPDVAANGLDFLLATSEEPIDHLRYVYGQRVGVDGSLLGGRTLIGSSYARFPSVAAVSGRWLVAWQRNATHDSPISSVLAAFVETSGAVGGTLAVEDAPAHAHDPSVAVLGDTALVTYDAGDARGRRIRGDGTLLGDPVGILISGADNAQFELAAGSDGARFFAAWTDYRIHYFLEAGVGDVYGARVESDGTVVEPGGLAVGNDYYAPEGNPGVAGDAGVTLIAHAAFRPEAPYGNWRIVVRTIEDGGLGVNYCGPAVPNSSGGPAVIAASGNSMAAANDLILEASGMPANQFGYFLAGQTPGFVSGPGGSQGNLCLAGTVARFAAQVQNSGAGGAFSISVDLTAIPTSPPSAVAAGETWNFQAWFRDMNPTLTSNFTDGVSITFR